MINKTTCPLCGAQADRDVIICPMCGSILAENLRDQRRVDMEEMGVIAEVIDGVATCNILNSWAFVETTKPILGGAPARYLITAMREVRDPSQGINDKRYMYMVCTPVALLTLSMAVAKFMEQPGFMLDLEQQIESEREGYLTTEKAEKAEGEK